MEDQEKKFERLWTQLKWDLRDMEAGRLLVTNMRHHMDLMEEREARYQETLRKRR